MHQVDVVTGFHDRAEHVVGGVDVVVDGVALVLAGLHGIGGSALFGVVNDRIRTLLAQQCQQPVVVMSDVEFDD